MQDDVLEIESNMIASRNAKIRSESGEREKIKQKEQVGTLGTNKIQDDKIEEMSRLNKDLSNKLDKIKTERRRHGNRNPN
jgi:archaellum component FlaC